MIISLISLVVTIALAGFIIWRGFANREPRGPRGHGIRRFFQYGTAYLLFVLTAIGLSGLLGRALGRAVTLSGGQSDLALDISFTVVGLPLLALMGFWIRRTIARDAAEVRSVGWAMATTAGTLTALGVTVYAAYNCGLLLFGINEYDGYDLAQLLVWGSSMLGLWFIDRLNTPERNGRPHLFIGSTLGLVLTATATVNTLSAAIDILLHASGQTMYSNDLDPLWRGLILAAIGIPVWVLYWFESARRSERDRLWYGYVLLLGTAGGMIASVVAASTAVYRSFVWWFGDPFTTSAAVHFRDVPTAASTAVVGAALWWYHQRLLLTPEPRNEIDRVYDYSMSAIGLGATGVGIAYAIVATIEGLTSATVLTGGSVMNTLLLAATLLIVGTPVWANYWQGISRAVFANHDTEVTAPTRRAYLFILFGVGGITAIAGLVSGVYLFADDMLGVGISSESFYRMRWALATLLATGGIAAYHWLVYDRERGVMRATQHGPQYILLIGPKDAELEASIEHVTGGRVHTWTPTNGFAGVWTAQAVMREVDHCQDDTLILFAEGSRLLAVPVQRD